MNWTLLNWHEMNQRILKSVWSLKLFKMEWNQSRSIKSPKCQRNLSNTAQWMNFESSTVLRFYGVKWPGRVLWKKIEHRLKKGFMESIIAPPFQAAFYYMAGCVLSKNKTRPRNFLKIAKNDPGCSLMLFNPRPSLRTLRTLRLPGRALIPPLYK